MKSLSLFTAMLLAALAARATTEKAAAKPAGAMIAVTPDAVAWGAPPNGLPAGARGAVLEGTLHLGMGEKWDEAALKAYPAGTYLSIPKGHKHFAYFKEAAVVQLNSIGPWGIVYIDPKDDPRR